MTTLNLPVWLQELFIWLSTGSNITLLISMFMSLIKCNAINKEFKAGMNIQVKLLDTIIEKLSSVNSVMLSVQTLSNDISGIIGYIEETSKTQAQNTNNLATFVMECFNRSNLTDETKAELQLLAKQLFYDDNATIIESLKQAKIESDNIMAEQMNEIAKLKTELEAEKQKLLIAQENVKTSRRL